MRGMKNLSLLKKFFSRSTIIFRHREDFNILTQLLIISSSFVFIFSIRQHKFKYESSLKIPIQTIQTNKEQNINSQMYCFPARYLLREKYWYALATIIIAIQTIEMYTRLVLIWFVFTNVQDWVYFRALCSYVNFSVTVNNF